MKILNQSKKTFPDLILIDGGKGQLHSTHKALQDIQLSNLPHLSLAKKEEMIFLPEKDNPIRLSRLNPGLKLLQRVRDEAHRFAIKYHKQLRSKELISKNKN